MEENIIDIAQLGEQIGMEAKEQTLPNGKDYKISIMGSRKFIKSSKCSKRIFKWKENQFKITAAAPACWYQH